MHDNNKSIAYLFTFKQLLYLERNLQSIPEILKAVSESNTKSSSLTTDRYHNIWELRVLNKI